jgi:type VI secretion system secreted protein VgrG
MPAPSQANQPLELVTQFGKDALLITSFSGGEGISRLFSYSINAIADAKKEIAFDKQLGQKATVRLTLPGGKQRFFNGIVIRMSQGDSDEHYTTYQMEMVPHAWLLTKKAQSRIFQQMSIPDILKKVLAGIDVVWQIDGTFHPRNYCVQYRETDFNFASRLMEEEGIYYFFTHAADGHKMVVANTPGSHPDMPINNKLTFQRMLANEWFDDRVLTWQKQQELITGQVTFRDHKFEMHGRNLEAKKTVVEAIQVGKATHKVKAGNAAALEVYDYPGEYARRFDGINAAGGEQPAEVKKILQDNERVAGIRSQQHAVKSVQVHGTSTCGNLTSGHKFTLQKHGHGDGDYLLTDVQFQTTAPIDYFGVGSAPFQFVNSFTAIPFAMPFRPQRVTPKPFVQGTQTALVVGPKGHEIYCDKYSRVKVQFHWDREGQFDAKSSCWVRVATTWAGQKWGIIAVPRIGHEVIVAFEEGDPDLPIIVGSVYNADHMPPGSLPDDRMVSGLRTNSTPGGGGYNGMICNDTKGKEAISTHAQYNMDTTVENNETHTVHNNREVTVDVDHTETVKGKQTSTVTGAVLETYKDAQSTIVTSGIFINSTGANIDICAATYILLSCGSSSIKLEAGGKITISGVDVEIKGSATLTTDSPANSMNGKDCSIAGSATVVMGTEGNGVATDTSSVTVAGTKVVSSASGNNEITGGLVKIN